MTDLQDTLTDKEVLERMAKAFRSANLDPAHLGAVRKVKFYEGYSKNDDTQEMATIPMVSVTVDPSWYEGPKYPLVQPADPVHIEPYIGEGQKLKGWKKAVILPDTQIGYRMMPDGVLEPFHDERALALSLQVIRDVQPDLIVNLGDGTDLPEWTTKKEWFEKSFTHTTQPAINRNYRFKVEQRAAAPNSEIVELEGNHDYRMSKLLQQHAKAAFGLRMADTPPDHWPVLTIPSLCRYDELGVQYISGYPANYFKINDNLVCIHGSRVNNSGSTAARIIKEERHSIICGHIHRIEMQHMTRRGFEEGSPRPKQNFAASPGCLCRTDGPVPSTKGGTDVWGRSVPNIEDWQQGLAVVTYEEGDGRFDYEQISIFEGLAVYRDKLYDFSEIEVDHHELAGPLG